MKGYESYFHRCQNPSYADHYIGYGLLKDKLRQFYTRRRQLTKILKDTDGRLTASDFSNLTGETVEGSSSSVGSYFRFADEEPLVDKEDALLRLSIMERKEFSSLLEQHVSGSAVFYSETLLPQVTQLVDSSNGEYKYQEAATQLLETIAFATTNIITFRQLLIRYDAFCRTFDNCMPLNEWHLQRSVLDVDHPVHGLFLLEGVDDLEKKIVMGMQMAADVEEKDGVLVQSTDDGTTSEVGEGSSTINMTVEDFTKQVQSLVYLLEKTDTSLEKAVAGHLVFKDRLLAFGMRMRQYMSFGLESRKSHNVLCAQQFLKPSLTHSFISMNVNEHQQPTQVVSSTNLHQSP